MRQRDYIGSSAGVRQAIAGAYADTAAAFGADPERNQVIIRSLGEFQCVTLEALEADEPDTPAKLYRRARRASLTNAVKSRAWKTRALNLNPASIDNAAALSGMAPIHDDERWQLAIAYPAPHPLGGPSQEITDLIIIDPKTGAASIHGDTGPTLVLPADADRFTVHADARVWAREYATDRLEWFFGELRRNRKVDAARPWHGAPPSALAIGDITRIQWPQATTITAGAGIDAKALRSVIFRQANIPHVEAPLQLGRAA